MFGAIRTASSRSSVRAFSSSAPRAADLAKLVLIGHLTRDPESRQTKNDREYVTYTVATQNYPPPPPDANGERRPSTATFHRILSFSENSNKYLQSLRKGTKVYVEAGFELREPEPGADPLSPQGQRQIFLKHETIRVLNRPRVEEKPEDSYT
ncbi:single-strand binding protein family-domain-containing protein [Collybia nuda]|uniref:Single-strand binding protein family-domain-containing protein n=1 Tax=Collybia nuda TaxID=64659 RepID=A0A9P5YJT9_9AGAR|nr:single-strand binding protein family-domain-containing protein [Collybia nuda]